MYLFPLFSKGSQCHLYIKKKIFFSPLGKHKSPCLEVLQIAKSWGKILQGSQDRAWKAVPAWE